MRVVGKGKVGPQFLCDYCGMPIENIGFGMVKFGMIHLEPIETRTPHFIVHKGDCDNATEKGHPPEDWLHDSPDGWMELSHYVLRAVMNARPPDDRAEDSMTDWLVKTFGSITRLKDSLP